MNTEESQTMSQKLKTGTTYHIDVLANTTYHIEKVLSKEVPLSPPPRKSCLRALGRDLCTI